MNSIKLTEEKNPIFFMIIALLKIFIFYFFMVGFSHKFGNIETVESFSTFITYLFSENTLVVLALSVATCIFSIVTLMPATFISFIIEKYIKGVIETELPFYIAIIISCLFFTYTTKLNTHVELYLCYLVFLPYEKIKLMFVDSYKTTLVIWSIAVLLIAFLPLTFKHLGKTSSDNGYVNRREAIIGKNDVYICTSKGAKVYHRYKDCKGLSRCSKQIKTVSVEQAKRMGRRECRICY